MSYNPLNKIQTHGPTHISEEMASVGRRKHILTIKAKKTNGQGMMVITSPFSNHILKINPGKKYQGC